MKKILFIMAILVIGTGAAKAADRFVPAVNLCIYQSSFTATNDTAKYIPESRYLKSIVVSSATAGGTLTVYDSTWTATGQALPVIDIGTKGVYEVDLVMTNGITYTTTGNVCGVALIYRKTYP